MAVTIFNETTLSEALASDTVDFTVGSTTNVTAGTSLLVVRSTGGEEILKVDAIPVSGRVQVVRGWNGTRAVAHPSGARVFITTPSDLKRTAGFTDTGGHFVQLVGDSGNFPAYALPGTRAKDGAGNEYVMVELTATCYSGTTVVISRDGTFTAAQAAGGTQGSIGLTVEQGSSDEYVWAQIYGYNSYAQETIGASAASSTYIAVPATTASTPSVGLAALAAATTNAAYVIHGMFIVGAATSTVTSAASATGLAVPVFLHYPFTLNRLESIETSNS